MAELKDISGFKFGKLTVLQRAERPDGTTQSNAWWLCQCECGTQKKLIASHLLNGATNSCGCLKSDILINRNTTHGKTKTKTYRIWHSMKKRCLYEKHPSYQNYGGRGIKVCDRWLNSFENFLQDMGEVPEGMSIERIDNNRNYEPDNCKWATRKEQSNNKRTTVMLEFNGKTQSALDWSKELGINYSTLKARFQRGKSVEEILRNDAEGNPITGSALTTFMETLP